MDIKRKLIFLIVILISATLISEKVDSNLIPFLKTKLAHNPIEKSIQLSALKRQNKLKSVTASYYCTGSSHRCDELEKELNTLQQFKKQKTPPIDKAEAHYRQQIIEHKLSTIPSVVLLALLDSPSEKNDELMLTLQLQKHAISQLRKQGFTIPYSETELIEKEMQQLKTST